MNTTKFSLKQKPLSVLFLPLAYFLFSVGSLNAMALNPTLPKNNFLIAQAQKWVRITAQNQIWSVEFPKTPHLERDDNIGLLYYVVANNDIVLSLSVSVAHPQISLERFVEIGIEQMGPRGEQFLSVAPITLGNKKGYEVIFVRYVNNTKCLVQDRTYRTSWQRYSYDINQSVSICNLSKEGQLKPLVQKFLQSLRLQ